MKKLCVKIFIFSYLLFPSLTVFGATELRDNAIDVKTNRIERKTGVQEVIGGNDDELFNEGKIQEIKDRQAKETAKREKEAAEIFLTQIDHVELYDTSVLFETAVETSEQQQSQEEQQEHNQNAGIVGGLAGGGLTVFIGGAVASVLNYRKGGA